MKTITFTCETITPMFLSGADGQTPELRPPSIKGALRFWWRAMNGHLSLEELKKQEGEIFGDTSKRSKVLIKLKNSPRDTGNYKPAPHKRYYASAFEPRQEFSISLMLIENEYINLEKLSALFQITAILGGFGKRIRRGMGSSKIINYTENENIIQYEKDITLSHIYKLLNKISLHFIMQGSAINYNHSGRMLKYGWIKNIEINDVLASDIPLKIANTTSYFHKKESRTYESSLGHAFKGRFASPVFVSLVDEKRVVITTLNTVPDRGQEKINLSLQENFKSTIFK